MVMQQREISSSNNNIEALVKKYIEELVVNYTHALLFLRPLGKAMRSTPNKKK